MTRKDYERLARALADTLQDQPSDDDLAARWDAVRLAALKIADTLAAANPRFDRVKFLNACGWAA